MEQQNIRGIGYFCTVVTFTATSCSFVSAYGRFGTNCCLQCYEIMKYSNKNIINNNNNNFLVYFCNIDLILNCIRFVVRYCICIFTFLMLVMCFFKYCLCILCLAFAASLTDRRSAQTARKYRWFNAILRNWIIIIIIIIISYQLYARYLQLYNWNKQCF
jgi:hypothetical protein